MSLHGVISALRPLFAETAPCYLLYVIESVAIMHVYRSFLITSNELSYLHTFGTHTGPPFLTACSYFSLPNHFVFTTAQFDM